jgi:4-aminobutyrate aminotransferase/(S)-3-amino-2-methylpropionate transaminase
MGGTMHATTLGGNCVSMAVAARLFEVIERDGLTDRARALGERIKARLRTLSDETGRIADVRGRGLFLGIELANADPGAGAHVVNACLEHGVVINATQGNVLRLAPPLVIGDDEVDQGLSVLEQVLRG